MASQGTNFGRVERRELSSNVVLRGLDFASRQKIDYSFSGSSEKEKEDSEIDFGSSMNFIGCAGGSGGRKKSTASSTVTSGATSSTSVGGTNSAGNCSASSGSGSGHGSNGGEDGEGGGNKKPPVDSPDLSETDSADEDDDEEGSDDPEFLPVQSTSSKRSGTSLLRRNVGETESTVRQSSEVRARQSLMDIRVRQADANPDGEVDGDEEEAEVAVGGPQPAGDTTEGKYVWRTSSDLNQETFPVKSKAAYQEAYRHFETFLKGQGEFVDGQAPSEEAFLNYFSYLKNDRHFASTTIWCTSAKLNACLKRKFGIRLQDYPNVSELMKSFDSEHVVKKAMNFSPQEVCYSLLELSFHIS